MVSPRWGGRTMLCPTLPVSSILHQLEDINAKNKVAQQTHCLSHRYEFWTSILSLSIYETCHKNTHYVIGIKFSRLLLCESV